MPRAFAAAAVLAAVVAALSGVGARAGGAGQAPAAAKPNIVLVITDDQGYGDLGVHGNPVLRTPHLDRLAREGVQVSHFYVTPVCAPTRAGLLTGRYNYRTGVVDTYRGRALMHPGETTLAEHLRAAGYRTGIFGKWHLGDNYPMRPEDQGFDETLVHRGGGIGQPSDPPGGESYFDPILRRNGTLTRTTGYVSDVITDAAIDFATAARSEPFFAYLAFNAPHSPLEAPPKLEAHYAGLGMTPAMFPSVGNPLQPVFRAEALAKQYAMVENIDENVGRLLAALDRSGRARNTIVIFLTDNGPDGNRYNAGMRGRKGTLYEGGIRVPFFIRWPAGLEGGRTLAGAAAAIDVVPTLLELTGSAAVPSSPALDGLSLGSWLRGRGGAPSRTIYAQWHRGDVPEKFRAFAARGERYKLVQNAGTREEPFRDPVFELFDLRADPYEQANLAGRHPELVESMKRDYAAWFDEVTKVRDYQSPSRIHLGAPQEPWSVLTKNDWRGPGAGWDAAGIGHWEVFVERAGAYDVVVRMPALPDGARVRFALGETVHVAKPAAGTTEVKFRALLARGPGRLEAAIEGQGPPRGVSFVELQPAEK